VSAFMTWLWPLANALPPNTLSGCWMACFGKVSPFDVKLGLLVKASWQDWSCCFLLRTLVTLMWWLLLYLLRSPLEQLYMFYPLSEYECVRRYVQWNLPNPAPL
jgi:hypothetical protein